MTARDLLSLAGLIPLLPLVGAAVLLLWGRRLGSPRAGWLATGIVFASFLWSVVMFAALLSLPPAARSHVSLVWTWLPADQLRVHIGFLADPLSITWCLLVTGVGSLIHLYAIGYMRHDPNFGRFFAYFNLFAASMLLLVLADNYLLTFLGWEGVGLCSYLLISFWFERRTAALGGKKAFIYNRIGDFGFMLAMFLLVVKFGNLDYTATNHAAAHASSGTVTAIALLLFLACVGKSAQVPLFPWLTDAMEGPTPVSALIHAATMVTAGIFLICRAHPFFDASPDTMTVVAWVGAVTALGAGTIAVLQPDIKRVLAYSTISQLGFMFLALGTGAYTAAIFLVIAHAFYKGCLFLGAGSVIHGNAENQDMRTMGALRKFLPITAAAMVAAWLAIAGVPPFAGFWAKDDVLSGDFFSHHYATWAIGVAAAVMTGVYMTRLIFLTFFGNERFRDAPTPAVSGGSDDDPPDVEAELGYDPDYLPTVVYGEPPRPPRLEGHDPHESPWTMALPIALLGALSVVGGLLNLPLRGVTWLESWLDPVFHSVHQPAPSTFVKGGEVTGIAFAAGLIGIVAAYALYRHGLRNPADDPMRDRLGPAADVVGHGYYYDDGISAAVDGPVRAGADFLDEDVDQGVIDGTVNGTARLIRRVATEFGRAQDGFVRRYAVGIALGAAAILLYLIAFAGH
ncbi:MAG TPA: NADH-quinone oxidoreductase subunit L [Acidimicrobiia bacterium]